MSSPGSTVKLNVGGTVFETLKSALTKHVGFFKKLVETNENSNCFLIDRSPKHFDTVLNYIRSGVAVLPDSERKLRELKEEACFYSLNHLTSLCDLPENKLKTYGSTQELLQIIASTRKIIVVINYISHNNELIYVPQKFKFF